MVRNRNSLGRGTHSNGTTLLETLLSTGIFALLSIAVFLMFGMGKGQWNVMYLRLNLQNQARGAVAAMERDLRRTDYNSVDVYTNPRITAGTLPYWTNVDIPRWAMCMVGLDDWSNNANFDPISGRPLWNRYIMYMATEETDLGGNFSVNGTGSGRFLQIVVQYNPTVCCRPPKPLLPYHFPAFVPTYTWVNNYYGLLPGRSEHVALQPPFLSGFDGIADGSLLAVGMGPSGPATLSPAALDSSITNPTSSTSTTTSMPPGSETMTPSATIDAVSVSPSTGLTGLPGAIAGTVPGSLAASFGAGTFIVTSKQLGNVFAFSVNKTDSFRVVSVTYKTRGEVSRSNGRMGNESQQINLTIAPEVHSSVH